MRRNFILLLPLGVIIFLVAGALISNLTYVFPEEEATAEPFAQAFMEAGFAEGSDAVTEIPDKYIAEDAESFEQFTQVLEKPYAESAIKPESVTIEDLKLRRHGFNKLDLAFKARIHTTDGKDVIRHVRLLIAHPDRKQRDVFLVEKAIGDGPILAPYFGLSEKADMDELLQYKMKSYDKAIQNAVQEK